jgi:hypothetical protein
MVEKLWLTGDELSCLIGLVKLLMQNLEIEPQSKIKMFGIRDIPALLLRLQEAYDRIGKEPVGGNKAFTGI